MTRVQTLLVRMMSNPGDAKNMKMCCGALAILSRTESHKVEIARDGLIIVIHAMQQHKSNSGFLETSFDLLWSLAFQNNGIKDMIGKYQGIQAVLQGMVLHPLKLEVLKSGLGTLSNLCQLAENQNTIGRNQGIELFVQILKANKVKTTFVPMVLDTLASATLGHRENGVKVRLAGGIVVLLELLQESGVEAVLKSVCHCLAILSDVPGHGKYMANHNGIQMVTSLLERYPNLSSIQNVGVSLLVRILNETKYYGQMIMDGVLGTLFTVLPKVQQDQETVAATCHVIYQLSEFALKSKLDISDQLIPQSCSPNTILHLIQNVHGAVFSIVRTVFRIFSNFARLPEVPTRFINMVVAENLLAFVLTHSKITDVVQCTITTLMAIDKSQVNSHVLKNKDSTLPALLICFHAQNDNSELVQVLFSLVATWVHNLNDVQEKNMSSLNGFIGAAIRRCSRLVQQTTSLHTCEIFQLCSFLDGVAQTKQGIESIKRCGGIALLDALYTKVSNEDASNFSLLVNMNRVISRLSGMPVKKLHIQTMIDDNENVRIVDNNREEDEKPATCSQPPFEAKPSIKRSSEAESLLFAIDQTEDNRNSQTLNQANATLIEPIPQIAKISKLESKTQSLIENPSTPSLVERCKPMTADERYIAIEKANQKRSKYISMGSNLSACLVYEGASAAGGNVKSRLRSPVPYEVACHDCTTEKCYKNEPLQFNSEFESGNLYKAIRVEEYAYDLMLRPDVHTGGFTQWFYFSIKNGSVPNQTKSQQYRFNIVNLCKPDSLFNQGLQPVLYSENNHRLHGTEWVRSGDEICYYSNPYPRSTSADGKSGDTYYTLSFTLNLSNVKDTYYVAHSYPYTVAQHRSHISSLVQQASLSTILRREVLCVTVGGLECDLLTISESVNVDDQAHQKKVIVLSARVHPGESQASWMMRGTIDFLVGQSDEAKLLRRLYVFRIVPMLNPDGVFYGNNRCGLSACDLNRQWSRPNKTLHPTVFATKSMIRTEHARSKVLLYCDLHGHSRKKNIFMYGCDSKKHPNPKVRIFPRMLSDSDIGKNFVSFSDCSFTLNKGKESTARVVVARELGILNSYTLEASFCGPDFGKFKGAHFNLDQLQSIGVALCTTILPFMVPDKNVRLTLLEHIDQTSGPNLLDDCGLQGASTSTSVVAQGLATQDKRVDPSSSREEDDTSRDHAYATKSEIKQKFEALGKKKNKKQSKKIKNATSILYNQASSRYEHAKSSFFPASISGATQALETIPGQRTIRTAAHNRRNSKPRYGSLPNATISAFLTPDTNKSSVENFNPLVSSINKMSKKLDLMLSQKTRRASNPKVNASLSRATTALGRARI